MYEFLTTIVFYTFYQPVFNLLMILYDVLGGNLGLAIVAIAAIAKLITIPITRKQLQSAEEMKVFQEKSQQLRKKYKKNKDKMNEELAKLSAKYMPAQLGGCLPLIITIVLLFQIRNVVIDLVNEGFHAFNEVAYVESIKKEEDSIIYVPESTLEPGQYEYRVEVEASNGASIEKSYEFEVVSNVEERLGSFETEELDKYQEQREEERAADLAVATEQYQTGIAIFTPIFESEDEDIAFTESVVLDRFLFFFPSETGTINLIPEGTEVSLETYMRAPSRESLNSVRVFLNDEEITEKSEIQKGQELNLNFAGLNLANVGVDFVSSVPNMIPYIVLALMLGGAQFVVTKVQTGLRDTSNDSKKKNDKKKKKKQDPEDLDFSEIMQQSSNQMIYFMPIFSVLLSLGVIGRSATGLAIFPAGVSLFWTAQNLFVIIQLAITKHKEISEKLFPNKTEDQKLLNKKDNNGKTD